MTIKAVSLFSSAGIGELSLPSSIDVVVANELVESRACCYRYFYPNTYMICGDIRNCNVKNEIINYSIEHECSLLMATPPCQGLSTLGKNKLQKHYEDDKRNYLIFDALDVIDSCDFDYVLIENVPKFLEMYFPFNNEYKKLEDILYSKYAKEYKIEARILNAKDYGIPQSRPRAVVKMWKKEKEWPWPQEEPEITLYEAIGHLPSLEPGEISSIKWHYANPLSERIAEAIRHTEPGKSAIANEYYYPKKKDGTRIKGFHNTYKRMVWDQPCPARTTYSGSISSHNNAHPGYKRKDGTYSDPRVLTLLETFIVSSIPSNIDFPKNTTDAFIRTIIGEAVPPKLLEKVVSLIGEKSDADSSSKK